MRPRRSRILAAGVLRCPRGKVLGGSSSINGMVYVRGHPLDFERWEEEGAKGWGYRNVLPYFRRAESFQGSADAYRGDAGPLTTAQGRKINPLYNAFIEAGRQAGYGSERRSQWRAAGGIWRARHDGGGMACVGRPPTPISRPAMKRPNLEVATHALATQIAFEGAGRPASATDVADGSKRRGRDARSSSAVARSIRRNS